jgi:hypothetical protein
MASRIHIPTARKNGEPYEPPKVVYAAGPYKRPPYRFEGSIFANPYNKAFRREEITREQSVSLFRDYAIATPRIIEELLSLPCDVIFGCWCPLDVECHVDVLIELMEERR